MNTLDLRLDFNYPGRVTSEQLPFSDLISAFSLLSTKQQCKVISSKTTTLINRVAKLTPWFCTCSSHSNTYGGLFAPAVDSTEWCNWRASLFRCYMVDLGANPFNPLKNEQTT